MFMLQDLNHHRRIPLQNVGYPAPMANLVAELAA